MHNISSVDYAKERLSLGNGVAAADDILTFLGRENCNEAVCLACSGGSDSVFLLKHVLENFPNLRGRLLLLHFNHRLRGADADGDERFVEQLAKNNGVGFYSEKLGSRPKKISEEILRDARDEFFWRAMEKFHSRILVLGHQKNDVAETLLMRLVRASEIAGLSAPRAVTVFKNNRLKLRPLLEFSKRTIGERLRAAGISWREDGSNFGNDFRRNRMRNIVLPKLQEAAIGVDVISGLAAAKRSIEEADDAVAFCAEKFIGDRDLSGEMFAGDLRELPTAIVKKIFAKFLIANGLQVRGTHMAALLENMRRGKESSICVEAGKFIQWDGECLKIFTGGKRDSWSVENLKIGTNVLPSGDLLRIENVDGGGEIMRNLRAIDVSRCCCAAISEDANISARSYEPSCRYVRFGRSTPRKIGDLLAAKIYPKRERERLPMVFADGAICWVPGLPVANFFRIKDGGEGALLLTYLQCVFS
ncbi:MAG: tRNA lysidine(34) synthetase TilS [Puniceicoccales bacterium]|jgi:tRNA(Ile)-lysidine synthase|nr:tRNA lysidine(34) synthetase TilS [Puniceicoccales bacterium]